jgi:hypothetical protein
MRRRLTLALAALAAAGALAAAAPATYHGVGPQPAAVIDGAASSCSDTYHDTGYC